MCPSECGFACVVCGGWRSTSNVNHSPSDDHWLARLTDQWAQGIPLLTAIQHWMTGMCHYVHLHGCWRSNISLDSCTTIILPTELSPPLLCSLLCGLSALLYDALCSASRLSGLLQWEASWRDREGERCRPVGQAGERDLQVTLVLYWKEGSWSKHSSVRTLVGSSRLGWSCPNCSKMIPDLLALLNIPLSPPWHFMHNLFPVSL